MKLHGKTNAELQQLMQEIESNPDNQNVPSKNDINLYTAKARKKLDEIRLQIAHNLAEAKAAATGVRVSQDGYSGRKSKKRR